MDSVNPNLSSEIIDQPSDGVTGSMECTTKHDDELNTRMRKDVDFSLGAINKRIEEVHKENSLIVVSAVETDIQKGDDISIDQCPRTESEFRGHHALTNQNQDSMTENLEAGLAGSLDESSYCLSGSLQIMKENENSVEATAAVSTDPEAFLNRGMPRRCLQFEDALHNVISNQPSHSPTQSEGPKSPSEMPLIPIKEKQADTTQNLCPRNMETNVKIPKPSGIGLHLNSIVNAVQAGSSAIIHVKSAQRCKVSIRGKKLIPITKSRLDSSNSCSIFTTTEDISASTDVNRHETHASLAVNSVTSLSSNIVNSSNNSNLLNPVDDQSTPGNKRMYPSSENDGNSEEFKSSPQKKRKKSSDSSDGCKRCNCKKSQCLKLYCDCFAAGIYCADPCSCQGCYNRPEYVDTVLETRQQIEIRNPLAFAPKIVQHKIEAPEDGPHSTPSSARHKRGCNCKKSMCLKKYCECYQANVGCSDGCGCEGCKNVYGQKGENGMDNDVLIKEGECANERTDDSLAEKLILSGDGGLFHSELSNSHNLIPLTPEVQFLNHRKDKSKARINSGQHFQSPESSLTSAIPCTMTPESCRNSDNNGMISETAGEVLDLLSSGQELCYGNAETPLDEFSPVCHQPGKFVNCSGGQSPQEQGNNCYSSMISLTWRGSPNTPMAQSSASKPPKVIDLDGELFNTTQDLTPDILKDNPAPRNAVKVSSPNKKRVSPPHRPRELGSSSVDGLRTGRKFILKAVPSFPLLTPSDSQRIRAQQTNGPRNHTSNN